MLPRLYWGIYTAVLGIVKDTLNSTINIGITVGGRGHEGQREKHHEKMKYSLWSKNKSQKSNRGKFL